MAHRRRIGLLTAGATPGCGRLSWRVLFGIRVFMIHYCYNCDKMRIDIKLAISPFSSIHFSGTCYVHGAVHPSPLLVLKLFVTLYPSGNDLRFSGSVCVLPVFTKHFSICVVHSTVTGAAPEAGGGAAVTAQALPLHSSRGESRNSVGE